MANANAKAPNNHICSAGVRGIWSRSTKANDVTPESTLPRAYMYRIPTSIRREPTAVYRKNFIAA